MRKMLQYFLESYYLFKCDLSEDIAVTTELPPDYTLVILKKDTGLMSALLSFWVDAYNEVPHLAERKIKCLFKAGNTALTVMANDKVAGMIWLGGEPAIENIDFANILRRENSPCIIHHHYVDVSHRGKKLQKYLMNVAFARAKGEGYSNLFVMVGVNNIASIVNCMKTFDVFKVIFHLKIDLPFFVINFFPKSSGLAWRTTRP